MVRVAQERPHVAPAGERGQVLADAEAAPGARQDDGPHVGVAGGLERVAEAGVHRVVERVQHLGPVERDREDGAVTGYLDFHSGLLFSTNALRPSRASSDANAR